MNFSEKLVYWYLRLNGFFPLSNFVLHQVEKRKTSDADLLAIRLPFVKELIGGMPDDWDQRFEGWGLNLSRHTIAFIVEVKSGRVVPKDMELASRKCRLRYAAQRIGLFRDAEVAEAVEALHRAPSFRSGDNVVAKLFVGTLPERYRESWHSVTLEQVDDFLVGRMTRYHEKRSDRMFFPDDLAQYLAWKHSGRG